MNSARRALWCGVFCALLLPLLARAEENKKDRAGAMEYLAGVQKLLDGSDFSTAEDMTRRALGADDTCPLAHFDLGVCLEKGNKPRDAVKEYLAAHDLADKERDTALAKKAQDNAKRLGGGLLEIDAADKTLLGKLLKLGDEALAAGQLETAKSAYSAAATLAPTNEQATGGLDKTNKAIEARGDPIKAKIAQAKLAEIWYQIGNGNKGEAMGQAKELALKYPDTDSGKEAADLVSRDFEAPKKEEIEKTKAVLVAQKAAEKAAPVVPAVATAPGTKPAADAATAPKTGLDVAALEATAAADAKALPKDALAAKFTETFTKGKDFYHKATPGSEGNQANVAGALEQFIRCEQLYMRLDDEKMMNPKVEDMEKQASMLRYACMKMTILSH